MKVVLYSTGCPRCKVLTSALDKKNIKYDVVSDVATIQAKGFLSVPVLEIDGETFMFTDAILKVKEMEVNE